MVGLLKKPGLRGHAVTNPVGSDFGPARLFPRRSFGQLNAAFKEVIVAATLYQCGDQDNVGYSILSQYDRDVNGHFASFARAILEQKGLPK
jgi:hypothetical protein